MKKLLFVVCILSLFIFSCIKVGSKEYCEKFPDDKDCKQQAQNSKEIEIIRFDGCEYLKHSIEIKNVSYFVYTHKGNCDNPIHMYNHVYGSIQ